MSSTNVKIERVTSFLGFDGSRHTTYTAAQNYNALRGSAVDFRDTLTQAVPAGLPAFSSLMTAVQSNPGYAIKLKAAIDKLVAVQKRAARKR